MFFVDQIVAPHPLQVTSQPGVSFPLHCTANGKAILASLPIDQLEKLVPENLQHITESYDFESG